MAPDGARWRQMAPNGWIFVWENGGLIWFNEF
jgi:hypothetical protein